MSIKEIFSLDKQSLMYFVIGMITIIVIIYKKIIPIVKKIEENKKLFYDDIDQKFDGILKTIQLGNKAVKELLKQRLIEMIDKCSKLGYKTHEDDDTFDEIFESYVALGNGNAESLRDQWSHIPFKNE